MIDGDTKQKFLKELAKSGNVYIASLKVGIHRDSHYRWKKEDKEYRKLANIAEKQGRENNCDLAEHALMINVKDKKMDAIKYVLSHNSAKYKPKRSSDVTIVHKNLAKLMPPVQEKTLEDLIDDHELKNGRIYGEIEKLLADRKDLPLKPNGSPILPDDYMEYEHYIRDWVNVHPPS